MESRTTDLRFELKMALSMLPRGVRHDLWRTCEPQHQHAIEAAVETIAARIEYAFELTPIEHPTNWSSAP
jgi:hypothetical protein